MDKNHSEFIEDLSDLTIVHALASVVMMLLTTAVTADSRNLADNQTIYGCDASFRSAKAGYDFRSTIKPWDGSAGTGSEQGFEGTVGKIYYSRLPIFDEQNPKEDRWLYRWANRFHVTTNKGVIQQQLLLKPGEPFDERLLRESERILRKNKYLAEAVLQAVRYCDQTVDLEVITREVWTFTPEVSLKRSGGNNSYRFSVRDTNIFGSGKQITVASKKDVDRNSNEFVYKDPSVVGTRIVGRIHLTDSDDGSRVFGHLHLPFYALDTRRAWGVRMEKFDRVDGQYRQDEKISAVRHQSEFYDANYGISGGLVNGVTRRFTLGYRYEQHEYTPVDELPAPDLFPANWTLSYPFFSYESVQDKYAKSFNLDQIHSTEDLHLGRKVVSRIGYSATDEDRLIMAGTLSNTLLFRKKMLLQHRLSWQGRWNFDSRQAEDVWVNYGLRFYRGQTQSRSFFASFSATYTSNLNSSRQVLLGGDNGLRGYPGRYQAGDRSYVFTMEERMYTDFHLLHLARVGWAIFADVGRAWSSVEDNGPNSGGLKDVGIGLRLSPSKSNQSQVIHMDLAFPIGRHTGIDKVQFILSIKDTF